MIKVTMIRFAIKPIFLLMLFPLISCGAGYTLQKVHTIKISDAGYDVPMITDKEKFLNDLMLSPYWKVEKDRDGYFRARARSISADYRGFNDRSSEMLLFEFEEDRILEIPDGYEISNRYMRGDDSYSTFSVDIVFHEPPEETEVNIYHIEYLTIISA